MTEVVIQLVSMKKVLFSLRKQGVKVASYEALRTSDTAQAKVAKDAGVSTAQVLAWFDEATVDPKTYQLHAPSSEFRVWYRPIKSPRTGEGQAYPSAKAFLDEFKGDRETLVEWDKGPELGCLDIDYHGVDKPSDEWLTTTIRTKLLPYPELWHLTPRGAHCFYPKTDKLNGPEIASLAALRWRSIDPTAGVEIKRQLRCPGGYGIVRAIGYGDLTTYVSDWLGSRSTVDPSAWLEENGFEIGQRYAHSHCPIDPTDSDNREPVIVAEDGIYCHRCSGLGISKGRGRPGYVSFASLVGSDGSGVIGSMVRHKTHWGHAEKVLASTLGFTGDVAKQAYSAAVKLQHGDSDGIFDPVTDSLVRVHPGHWATVAEGYTFPKNIEPILRRLPVTAGDPGTVCLLSQPTIDFTEWGYPSIEILRGGKMGSIHVSSPRVVYPTPASWLRGFGSMYYPKWLPNPMPLDKAKATLETVLPGIDWTYLTLLLMARGCHENQTGLPQHILVEGASQTGKTAHVQLAAGILGDSVSPIEATVDQDRFRSSIRDGSQRGSYLSLDEFLKTTVRLNPRLTYEQVFEPLLNFDPESLSHKLFVGPTALGRVGVCVWTDTCFPPTLHDYTQIARRVHVYRLTRLVQWDTTLTSHGISDVKLIRTVSPEHAVACDSVLTHVANTYFRTPLTFHQLAPQIGVTTLANSEEFHDLTQKRIDFFNAVCDAPELGKTDANRWQGRGYKLILRGGDDKLSELWQGFCNGGKHWDQSTRLKEKPWNSLLKVDSPVELDILPSHGPRMVVRFRQGPLRNPTRINSEIRRS